MIATTTKFDDMASPECQSVLRQVRDAILRNKFSAPAMPLSPKLASKLKQFRATVGGTCFMLGTATDRVMVLVAPRDGGDLFVQELRDD